MDDEAALRAAVRANRGDATPRLVLADWLDDHGDPLGAALQRVLARPDDDGLRLAYADVCDQIGRGSASAFIRGQLAKTIPVRNVPLTHLLTLEPVVGPEPRRYTTNLSARPGVAEVSYPDGTTYAFVRGFVEHVTCYGDRWMELADAVAEAHPVRRVRLVTTPPYVSRDDPAQRRRRWWFAGREDCVYHVDEAAIRAAGDYRHAAEVGRHAMLELLRLNWPQIEFEVPVVPAQPAWSERRPDRALDIIRRAAEQYASEDAAATEAIARAVAAEYGIEDVEHAARDRRMVRVEGVGDRPAWVVACYCGREMSLRRIGETMTSPDDFSMRTVGLRAQEWRQNATGNLVIRRTVRRGRCDGCGVVYFSIRRR